MIFDKSIPNNISNEAWAGFLSSYIGGLCTMIAVFITIKYCKDSDKKKEKVAIQPFLHVTATGNDREPRRRFYLPWKTEKKQDEIKKVNINIKNIGNGFATTLVIYTGFNLGGIASSL